MTSSSASSCFFFAINLKRNTLYSLESRMQYLTFALLLERTYSYHYDENYILEQVRVILHLQGLDLDILFISVCTSLTLAGCLSLKISMADLPSLFLRDKSHPAAIREITIGI